MIKIVTDGSVDMPSDWREEYDIKVIPLMVRFGEQVYIVGVDFNNAKFYQMVIERKEVPKSSLPSPSQVMDFYRSIAQKGDTILSIHLSSKLSGTFATIQMAARELLDEFNIITFDSGAGSAALGFMCREARLMDRAGISLREISHRLEEIQKRLTVIFTLDTLEFARLNGRVSALQTAITSILKVKPIILLRDGFLNMIDKVRTRQRSLDRLLEIVKERVGNRPINVAVVHAADPITAQSILERVKQMFNVREIIMTDLSIPVAANLGPGTVGVVVYPVDW